MGSHRGGAFALSAKHSISVLFADYWNGDDRGLPSSAVVRLLDEFDFTEHGSRAALRALVADGVLRTWKAGRQSIYAPTAWTLDRQARVAQDASRPDPGLVEWDPIWTVLTFTASQHSGTRRNAVRRQLRVLGLRPLYPGVWVAPRDRAEEVADEMEYRGIDDYSVFTTRDTARRRPFTAAWSADDIDERYARFIAEFARTDPGLTGTDALVARSRVMDAWRLRRKFDPGLPESLIPVRNRTEAGRVFRRLYDGLRGAAETRVRELISEIDEDAAARLWSYGTDGVGRSH